MSYSAAVKSANMFYEIVRETYRQFYTYAIDAAYDHKKAAKNIPVLTKQFRDVELKIRKILMARRRHSYSSVAPKLELPSIELLLNESVPEFPAKDRAAIMAERKTILDIIANYERQQTAKNGQIPSNVLSLNHLLESSAAR